MNTPVPTDQQSGSARRIAWIGITGSAIAGLFYLYLFVQQSAWQLAGLFVDTFVLLIAATISLFLIQRGSITKGILLLIGVAQIVFAVGTALITSIGLAFALGIAFITAMIATETLPSRETVITAITAAISGITSIIIDSWAPSYRLPAPLLVQIFIPTLIAIIVLIFAYLLIQQFRRSLRAKLLLGFIVVFLVSGVFGAFAIRQQYIGTQQAAVTEASNVTEAIALSVGRYPASAQDYVAQLSRSQQRRALIVDLQKRILADPNSAAVFTTYSSDPGEEVAATLKDGQIRTYIENSEVSPSGPNMIVAPVRDPAGKITGAAIVDYTSLLGQLQSATNATVQALTTFGAAGLILLFAIILFVASQIADPVILLQNAAVEVGRGNLDVAIPDQPSEDEIGTLSASFKNMANQLRDLIGTLEQRVRERTSELASANQEVSHRAAQLEAIAKVTRSIASIQDLQTILPEIAQTISEEFGFYHIGIFMLDEAKQFAVLQAANSQGGQAMLQHGHRLKVGEQGIVGFVAANAIPRIALDTGVDAVFFNNPDLPTTRSEMALPLILNEQTIGVLDVQSEEPSAFTQEDIEVLATLAEQVSIAIQNARLFDETNRSLREARGLYEQFIQSALSETAEEKKVGYQLKGTSLASLSTPMVSPEIEMVLAKGDTIVKPVDTERNAAILTIPIKLRGNVIGVLDIRSQDKADWGQDDIDIAQAVAERVALAVENATLLEDSQRRASKERIIGEVTTKISQSINLRNVLQTAVEELGHVIPGSDVIIQLEAGNGKSGKQEKQHL
ncbi:MAG TPA: GAF domain-containing protein [Anaerolineales bacterium]|nr:GAF domain-containing protein [Anaerolineales bacterium]